MRGPGPLLVTSPTLRSGSTLVQRLLCSAPDAIIYGEEIGKDLDLLLQVLASRRMVYAQSRPRLDQGLARVLAGDPNDWLIDLMPDLGAYDAALVDATYAGLSACAAHAVAVGRPAWGFKYPGWAPPLLHMLARDRPGTRAVYVVRRLADTVRSAKAWGVLPDAAALQAFGAQWLGHQRQMRSAPCPVLRLAFEALVPGDPAPLAALQAFAGVHSLDPAVLGQRINNHAATIAIGQPEPGYVPPAPLAPEEQDWVDQVQAQADAEDAAAIG